MAIKSGSEFVCIVCGDELGEPFAECPKERCKERRRLHNHGTFGLYGGSPWAHAFKHDQMDFQGSTMGDSMETMQEECGINR